MTSFWLDLRHALRFLRLSPGFTFVAVLTLSLGVGANTAIFQLIYSIRLRTIPVKNPQELGTIRIADRHWGFRPVFEPVFPAHLCYVGADPQAPGRLLRNSRLVRPAVQSGHGRGGPQSKRHPCQRRLLSRPGRRADFGEAAWSSG